MKMYKKIFISAKNMSVIKTLLFNMFFLKLIVPKVYLGKKTDLILSEKSKIVLNESRLFFDCKNNGQFWFHSSIRMLEGAILKIHGDVNFFSGLQLMMHKGSVLEIGKDTYFSGPITIHVKKRIVIGNDCSIAWNCTILDSNYHNVDVKSEIKTNEVMIGDRVWVGCNVTILQGVTIGDDVIVGAGSVVTTNLISEGVYAGNPAKLIRMRLL